jgi:hypothetical protein
VFLSLSATSGDRRALPDLGDAFGMRQKITREASRLATAHRFLLHAQKHGIALVTYKTRAAGMKRPPPPPWANIQPPVAQSIREKPAGHGPRNSPSTGHSGRLGRVFLRGVGSLPVSAPLESFPKMNEPKPPHYVAVSRGRSAAAFRENDEWTVRAFPAGSSRVDVTFRTAYVSYGFEAKAPRWLYAEVSGPAESLKDAIRRFPNAVRSLTPVFDVALNASVDDLDLHLGFDGTSGREEREFFQNFLHEDPPTPRQVRQVDTGLLSCLTEAIARHPDNVRLHRAAAHYQQALRFWSFGDETRAVGQLWMGFEALTPVAKRQELIRTGATTSVELADALHIEKTDLDSTLRRTVLFGGDDRAYSTTKKLSDGFEHGFIPLDELRVLARGTRDTSATHLRSAVVHLSGVPDPALSEMLGEPYTTPIIGFPITKYLRGKLKGAGDLAPHGQRYPSVTWRTDIEHFSRRDEGGHNLRWNEKITPKIGIGIYLTDISIEMWSGDTLPAGSVTIQKTDVVRTSTDYGAPSMVSSANHVRPRRCWRLLYDRLMRLIVTSDAPGNG